MGAWGGIDAGEGKVEVLGEEEGVSALSDPEGEDGIEPKKEDLLPPPPGLKTNSESFFTPSMGGVLALP